MTIGTVNTDALKMCEYVFKQGAPQGQKCMRLVTVRDPAGKFCCAHYKLKRVAGEAPPSWSGVQEELAGCAGGA